MFRKLTLFTLLLMIFLLAAGAYARISAIGLGCPDWPGCYDGLGTAAPHSGAALDWIATVHRYLGGAVGMLVLVLAGGVFTIRENRGRAIALAYGALLLAGLQAALGLWAAEFSALPPVATAHWLLGVLTLASLYRLFLAVGPQEGPSGDTVGLRWLGRIALLVLYAQLFLGNWVSSNYAGLSCPDFPACLGSWWPESDYLEGFKLWRSIEPGGQGAVLPASALIALHWAHRIGAFLVFLLLSVLAMGVTSNPKAPRLSKAGLWLSVLLLVEIGLGIAALRLRLPVILATAHSVVGLLLLLDLIHIQYFLGLPRRAEAKEPPLAPTLPEAAPLPEPIPEIEPPAESAAPVAQAPTPTMEVAERPASEGLFRRLKSGLGKTRGGLTGFLSSLALGKKAIDRELLDDIEAQLLTADIGVAATREIIGHLTESLDRDQLADVGALTLKLREYLYEILEPVSNPLAVPQEPRPFVILVVGVNGVGKTTTIGKLARRFQADGHSVMLAAGDTFRAAAVEQLQTWGERNNVYVVAQHTGADSASVIFDAVQAAKARGVDVLIADTAGRLHTKSNLMEELSKIKRIMRRLDESAPHEVLLVVDSGTGQNAINQTRQFNEAVGLTGIALTKLDGTAKGGVIFALAKQFGIPIRYIGVGEGIGDLQDFDAGKFIEALFAE